MTTILRYTTRFEKQFDQLAKHWEDGQFVRQASPEELCLLAVGIESLAAQGIPGDILECSHYTGFSAICLSLVCKEFGKKLYIADVGTEVHMHDMTQRDLLRQHARFMSTRVARDHNLTKYGCPEVVEVLAGRCADNLVGWNKPLAMIWLDLVNGAEVRSALRPTLPKLHPCGLLYSHGAIGDYFDDYTINDRCNEIWHTIKTLLHGRRYHATYHYHNLGEVAFDECSDSR